MKSVHFLPPLGDIASVMNAIEMTGIVDAQHQLRLDGPPPIAGPSRVQVIILVPESGDKRTPGQKRPPAARHLIF